MILIFSILLSIASVFSSPCQPQYDQLGIPHLETKSEKDFYYCFGYQHAIDRAWEMDFFRRLAQGRNAEVLGFSHLKSDLMMRFLSLDDKATSLWKDFPQSHRLILESYSAGVNEGFKIGKNAKEFQDLGFSPETWEPKHTLLVLLIQSFDQTRKTFFRDYEEEKDKETWGQKTDDLFSEEQLPWTNTILKDGEYKKSLRSSSVPKTHHSIVKLWSQFPTLFGEESGSNNWVVSGKKSKSGKAILANDPHLDLKTPMFWYWINIKSPTVKVMGASVPGVPVIASGTNGSVAWGLTNAYINTADAVYASDLKNEDIVSIRPFVKIKFGFLTLPFFFKSFEQTKDGFKVLPLETASEHKLLLRWTGFGLTSEDILPMFDMGKIKTVKEMSSLLSKIGLPAWNYVFADQNGDIGFRVIGKAYRQTQKNPYGISLKTMKEIREEDLLDATEIPQVLNPKRQYIYTANNRHWPEDATFYGGRGYSFPFRALRIEEKLAEKQTPESFKQIQCDRQVVDARFFLPRILKYISSSELERWSLLSEDSSRALPLYRRLMDLMMENWKVNENALYRLLENPTETHKKNLNDFFQTALSDVNGRTWGEIHRLGFVHLSKSSDWKFSPEIAGPGDNHSVDPGTSKWDVNRKIYDQTSGASMRMIIELDREPKIELALPGLNRGYAEKSSANPWESWKACRYSKISF